MEKVSFIIVNYNTRDLLDQCLANLTPMSLLKEIIVVDNASDDESAVMVSDKYDGQVLLIKTQNNGIAAGYNLGLSKASGDFIVYIGTDAYPMEAAISEMIKYMRLNLDVGILTPKLITRDKEIDWDAHRGFPTPWAALSHFTRLNNIFPKSPIFNQYFRGYQDFNFPHEIDVCISHFMFTRKEIYEHISGWDEDFFVYGEDVDFCYRVKNAGFKIVYLPQIEVLHYKGAGIGRKTSSGIKNLSNLSIETRKKMAEASAQAMRIFYSKHYTDKYPKVISACILSLISILEKLRIYKAGKIKPDDDIE